MPFLPFMEQPDRPTADDEEWAKTQAEADIASFKNLVEDATVEEVDEPTGRKEIEIAWEDEDGFYVEKGEVAGFYRERGTVYHMDWSDDRERTTVRQEDVTHLDEGDWYSE